MIEVYDIKDAGPNKLDITPELALAAYNTLIQFCRQQAVGEDGVCLNCILYNNCARSFNSDPENWSEIHYPYMDGNSIFYLKDGKVREITRANRQEAEETLKEMMER